MSERDQKTRRSGDATYGWQRFRRVCALSALGTAHRRVTHAPLETQNAVNASELRGDLRQQRDLQHTLALEYANALSELEQTQQQINEASRAELDARLEAQVLELAICEEAYEIVCEEVESLRAVLQPLKQHIE